MSDILEKTNAEAVVPTAADTALAEEASRVIAARPRDRLRIRIGDDGEELTLPHAAERLIGLLLTEIAQGNAVTLIPIHAEFTTQEAADYLNVSRPYLIGLLNTGAIPFHMVGTHRRIKFAALMAYAKASEAKQKAALDELVRQAQELNLGY
jgi:excisionase family DNA binding protein